MLNVGPGKKGVKVRNRMSEENDSTVLYLFKAQAAWLF